MLQQMPPEISAQVVFGKYVEHSGLVFSAEIVTNLFDYQLPRVLEETYLDREAAMQSSIARSSGRFNPYQYAIGVDTARKKDYTVITVLDTVSKPARVVYFRRTNRVPWPSIYAEIGRAQFLFPGELLVDATGQGGDVVLEALESTCYCPIHHTAFDAAQRCPKRSQGAACDPKLIFRLNPEGFIFSAGSKVQLVNHLQQCMGRGYDPENPAKPFGAIKSPPIKALEDELVEYAWDDKKLQTDCVFSLALAAWQGLEQEVGDVSVGSPFGR